MGRVGFRLFDLRCRTKLRTFFCFLMVVLSVCIVIITSLLVHRHYFHNDAVHRMIVGAWHAPSVHPDYVCVFFADGTYRFDDWKEFCAMIGSCGEITPPDKNDGYWRVKAGELLVTRDEVIHVSRGFYVSDLPSVSLREWGSFGYFSFNENRLTLDRTTKGGRKEVWVRVSAEEIISGKKSESQGNHKRNQGGSVSE